MYKWYFQPQWKDVNSYERLDQEEIYRYRTEAFYSRAEENREVERAEEQIKKRGTEDKAVREEGLFISL